MNLPPRTANEIASVLGCAISPLIRPCLGPPLTSTEVRMADLHPLLSRLDKYFAGWCGWKLDEKYVARL